MDKVYDHKIAEGRWYSFWEKCRFFAPKINQNKKPFTIIMPPPNANGELHVGHAAFIALEDILIRYHRMRGEPTLWLPGADHAGIQTQVVYERELAKKGKTRFDLGREDFFRQTYDFSIKSKTQMEDQFRALGASCDWTREKFTLDPEITRAVYTTFKKLHDDGLIYRGERIINWCTRCGTALSDLEVEHEERKGKLWYIKYPIQKSKFIVVATTRPETMLGDTAVAVNPSDRRYKDLISQTVILPLGKREIPIIADTAVDPDFGTGAVKVTPAHDPIDFEIASRHKLEIISVIGQDGRLTKYAGDFSGLKILEGRERVIEELRKQRLVEKIEDYTYSIGICERCRATVEPLISKQWFIKIGPLAKRALEAVETGTVKILPKRFEKIYFNWLENIRDWCISRQIWWGQQIPVWYCGKEKGLAKPLGFYEKDVPQLLTGKTKTYRLKDHWYKVGDKVAFHQSGTNKILGFGIISAVEASAVGKLPLHDPAHGAVYQKREELIAAFKRYCPKIDVTENTPAFIYSYKFTPTKNRIVGCGEIIASQDRPEKCPRCGNEKLEQDPDTLDTWFSSGQWPFTTLGWPKETQDFKYFYPTSVMETGYDILFFWVARMIMLGLYATGKPPFHTVFLHGLVRDEQGQKMSKSKGNVIDPLVVAEKYGADAVRMALVFGTSPGNDINLGESKIQGMRNFTNKVWNIGRFIIEMKPAEVNSKNSELTVEDKWVLEELEKTKKKVAVDLENYRFGQATEELYDFIWHRFADKYIEHSKTRRVESQSILEKVFEEYLRLLHPFMPFITEELWQRFPNKVGRSIMVAAWPK